MKKQLFLIVILFCSTQLFSQQIHRKTLKLMGSRFDISVVAASPADGEKYIDLAVAEISRIEKLISSWDANSETSEINRNAGLKPVKVSSELYDLIKRAIQISKITDSAFDISSGTLNWHGGFNLEPTDHVYIKYLTLVNN